MAEDDLVVPSLADILGQLDEEHRQEESREKKPLVLEEAEDPEREDAAISHSVNCLLDGAEAELAAAVAFFGPGALMLFVLRHTLCCDQAEGGETALLEAEMRWVQDQSGQVDADRLLKELQTEEKQLATILSGQSRADLVRDVCILQDWRRRAVARFRVLEQRAAWSMLGIPYTKDQSMIRKAFKKRALELHPDKGGDSDNFQFLQEMKGVLVEDSADVHDDTAVEKSPQKPGKSSKSDGDRRSEDADTDDEVERLLGKNRSASDAKATEQDTDKPVQKVDDRTALEATRRRLHQAVCLLWQRLGRLSSQLSGSGANERSEATRENAMTALRRFVDRFASAELIGTSLQQPETCILQLLRQGAEDICAAAVLDFSGTSAELAGRVHSRLLPGAASELLQRRWSGLLEGLRCLPSYSKELMATASSAPQVRENSDGEVANCEESQTTSYAEAVNALADSASEAKTDNIMLAAKEEYLLQVDANASTNLISATALAHESTVSTSKARARPRKCEPGCVCTICLRRRWGFQKQNGGYS